jgi:hypothetical protein
MARAILRTAALSVETFLVLLPDVIMVNDDPVRQ